MMVYTFSILILIAAILLLIIIAKNYYSRNNSNKMDNEFSTWEYGICNGRQARRHKVNNNVQFILFKKGDQKDVDGIGHIEDKWVDFDSSWWVDFIIKN